jgi:DNA replication protein DnaC
MTTVQQTLSKLRQLKLTGMAAGYENQLDQPNLHRGSFDERFAMIVDQESSARESRRLTRLIRGSGFPEPASLEDLDAAPARKLDSSLIAALATCEWIRRQQNLIVIGATGVGKTWLSCAFGVQACRHGFAVQYHTAVSLFGDIATAMADGSLAALKAKLIRPTVMIIDDLGNGELTLPVGHVLLDVIDRRMRAGSLILASQYPKDAWHGFFPDPTLADAVLDRVVHQAHRVELKGESLRKVYAKKRMGSR